MSYVNMKSILTDARKNRYAVGAFNIVNYLTAKAAIEGAEELKQNIIIQTSVKTVKSFGAAEMMSWLKPIAENASVKVAIHLDHSTDVEFTKLCIDAGWSSVMYDGSKLPLSENIANTKEIVDYAQKFDVTVEGELGAIVGVEDDVYVKEGEGAHARLEDCKVFLSETKVDAFAPAIGTAHGVYEGEINIDYDLFETINNSSPCPLVLHGGTGLTDGMFYSLIDLGAAKVNISTAIKIAYCSGMKDFVEQNPKQNDPLKLDAYVKEQVKKVVQEHIRFFSLTDRKRPNYEVDLHCHTTNSDGSDNAKELIDKASRLGMRVIAITDHDVLPLEKIEVNGSMIRIQTYAKTKGVKVIQGIEFSCETEVEDVHLIVLGCDYDNEKIRDMNKKIVKSKIHSYRELTEVLTEKGYPILWDEVINYGGIQRKPENVQKKNIFNLMAEKGYFESWSEAKLMCRNNPEYRVKRQKPKAVDIINLAHEAGGICILAHPYLINETVEIDGKRISRDEFIESLIEADLDGIEASYTYDKTTYPGKLTKNEIIEKIIELYTDKVKIISGGSDYHADYKKTSKNVREIGECGISYDYFRKNAQLSSIAK
ncbi:ketose-bisphosphate aldolase [uncultured Acetobacterium sp.]|uniref:ketose-bisphosphate aldolase n=1 Tax=uncultured Acetobacterium sp. TaxID=217139 RepID=UPI0025CE32EC|nr:ketose-bisphosphate aldolase [uncultured Acetobacterium sp.]